MPKPGDIGFTRIEGVLGKFVYLAQWFNGDRSRWTHVFLVLSDEYVFEARPGGAAILPMSDYDHREVHFVSPHLTSSQRARIVAEARMLVGTPYSFMDYFALFLQRTGLCRGLTRRYVKDSGHMICSQAVDEAYRRAGIHLFEDGRPPQEVTPGDLARVFGIG